MIYISLGIAISIFALIFLIYGIKHHDREMLMGSIPVLAVGIFVAVISTILFLAR